MTLALAVLGPAVYVAIAGLTAALLMRKPWTDDVFPFVGGTFWPLTLTLWPLGILASYVYHRTDRYLDSREEQKRLPKATLRR